MWTARNIPVSFPPPPFCYRLGDGYVVIFRYGVVVFVGLTEAEEKDALAQFPAEHTAAIEEEHVALEIHPGQEEGATASGGVFSSRN